MSEHLIAKILPSAAINQRIDVPAAPLCVFTVYTIDLLCCDADCAETVGAQRGSTCINSHLE